jgi:hypothetical protein
VGQLPTGEADLIVRGLAELVRIIGTGVPASVETVARRLTAPPAAGTWHPSTPGRAVASREVPGPSSRVNPPLGSSGSGLTRLAVPQVRQYRTPGAGEEHPPVDRERPGPLRP